MTVVSDSGPLMALAKVGGLPVLFRLFPQILTPPAVYQELVVEGLRLQAPDAAILEAHYQAQNLVLVPQVGGALSRPAPLGPGEEQSILLALERQAIWLLIDDLDARRAALGILKASGSETRLMGTLGVILAARESGHIPKEEALGLVESLRQRLDIWISASLCDRVADLLRRG